MLKKILKITAVILLLLIATAFAAPFLFKGKILTLVKEQINKNVNAKVDFEDVDISFFRSFPKVAVGLDSIKVVGVDQFASDTLISAKRIDVALDIMSVIKGSDMKVHSIDVESPRIHAIVAKDGKANWDIAKEDTTTTTTAEQKPFKMELQKYAISDAYVLYDDKESNMRAEIMGLQHEGSGDFTADLFTLKTITSADAVNFSYGGVPYLSKVKAAIDADFKIDNKANTYTYATDKITANELQLNSEGVIKNLAEKGFDLDIKFKSPSTDFKSILSLVPVIYQNDFAKIKTSGNAQFAGFVKGIYNDSQMPAYHLNMNVTNGFFQYPDLPKPVKNINIAAVVDNPNGITDNTVVNIEKAHVEFDNDPFDFRILVKNPVSNMYVDAAAKGKLDLSKITQFVKLEQGTKLSGLIDADVNVKGAVAAIEKQQFDQFSAGGNISMSQFFYASKDYPTGVKINTLQSTFSPQKITLSNITGNYMSSNFSASGQVNNLLNYALQGKPLSATFNLAADKVNVYDWMGTEADTTVKGEASKPFVVPTNLDVTVAAKVDELLYDKLSIRQMSGALKINDETIKINDAKGNALDGTIAVNGTYSTKLSKDKPDISMDYSVSQVDVQKTFYAFNTVQKLMPIGQFIAGKLTSKLSLTGKLGDNMMPDLSSLSGAGDLFLLQGFLSKFAPLDKIASTLNVKDLEQVSLKDIKNSFEFANGKVLVKPFKVKIKDIDMEIGGTQGFDQSLNFLVNMKLPRALMGTQGNQLINNLASQASSKGVPVNIGETVNLNLNLGGFIKKPTVKTDLKQGAASLTDQLKQQATDFAKAKIDSTKKAVTNAVKDTVKAIKNQMISNAKDELTKKLLGGGNAGTDTQQAPKPKPAEQVKGLINNLFKKKAKDTSGTSK